MTLRPAKVKRGSLAWKTALPASPAGDFPTSDNVSYVRLRWLFFPGNTQMEH
jgi:hypothetical protein